MAQAQTCWHWTNQPIQPVYRLNIDTQLACSDVTHCPVCNHSLLLKKDSERRCHLPTDLWISLLKSELYDLWWGHVCCEHHQRHPAQADPGESNTHGTTQHKVVHTTFESGKIRNTVFSRRQITDLSQTCTGQKLRFWIGEMFGFCLQDKRALGFQRVYHVTDPFIKRLGLEAELQVTSLYKHKCVCLWVCVVWCGVCVWCACVHPLMASCLHVWT